MRLALGVLGLAALAACEPAEPPSPVTRAADDFAGLCAPCHGPGGKGDGPLAAELAKKPADLTGLSARHGGAFPYPYVMSKIWGYERGAAPASIMPKFAPLMEGPTVLVDTGDGIPTPTPKRLADLANYLAQLQ